MANHERLKCSGNVFVYYLLYFLLVSVCHVLEARANYVNLFFFRGFDPTPCDVIYAYSRNKLNGSRSFAVYFSELHVNNKFAAFFDQEMKKNIPMKTTATRKTVACQTERTSANQVGHLIH